MGRFNLICHGMMLFVEKDDSIDILIPEIDPHKYRMGQPVNEAGLGLKEIALGFTEIKVPGASFTGAMSRILNFRNNLVLRSSAISVCGTARRVIRVPKPDRVREFRAAEVGDDVFGTVDPSCSFEKPFLLHEAACLSYLNVPEGESVMIPDSGSTISLDADAGVSWCIYAQPEEPETRPHPTSQLNDLLCIARTSNTHADFQLSIETPGDEDYAPARGLGIDQTHLSSLIELKAAQSGQETEAGGCYYAWHVKDSSKA
jgi:hypothetical protein